VSRNRCEKLNVPPTKPKCGDDFGVREIIVEVAVFDESLRSEFLWIGENLVVMKHCAAAG
jgi:hypothetical protein